MQTAIFTNTPGNVDTVFGHGRRDRLAAESDLYPATISQANFDEHADRLRGVEAIFSTWGLWAPSPAQFDRLPALKAVFYAAGATDDFARAFFARGVEVFSAWQANAIPVAEFAASQILLALKGYFRNARECTARDRWRSGCFRGPGAYRETVALIGDGEIATRTRARLETSDLDLVVIPSRPSWRTVSLEEAFRTAFVVSNHLPNRDDNKHCLTRAMFESLRPGATFINTGRGAQVDEPGMAEVARQRPDLTFLLDVTDPEPPAEGSPLYALPNIHLSTHIAGSIGGEVLRMADFMIDDFRRWRAGEPVRHQVVEAMLMTS